MITVTPEPGFSISPERRHTTLSTPEASEFGATFGPVMAFTRWTMDSGWEPLGDGPLSDLVISPAAMVFHYGQAIFEGLKAFRSTSGELSVFRPEMNASRFRRSAARMAMPELPDEVFLDALDRVVGGAAELVPERGAGSLYLRPFMVATEARLGTRPAREFLFLVISSRVGDYFANGQEAIRVRLSGDNARAFPGGTGFAKCAGNYAASMATYADAAAEGFDQVVWLDASEHRYVEELGSMNLFLVRRAHGRAELLTPPLADTLLAGVTRDSLLILGAESGLAVKEIPIDWRWWKQEAEAGRVAEAFACGTGAAIYPIATVSSPEGDWTMQDGRIGPVTRALRDLLTEVQAEGKPHPDWRRVVR